MPWPLQLGVGDDRWWWRRGGQTAAVRQGSGASRRVHALGDRTRLGLLFGMVIVEVHASYRRMAAGAHYPVD
jgi:hypothetical protein